jgi:hypothetical protein
MNGMACDLARGQAQQGRRCAGPQRDGHAFHLLAHAHHDRCGRSADRLHRLPRAFARGRRCTEIEDEAYRAIGQHALQNLMPRREGLAIQEDVRDMRTQRRTHRKRAQCAGGRARFRPMQGVVVEPEEEAFAHRSIVLKNPAAREPPAVAENHPLECPPPPPSPFSIRSAAAPMRCGPGSR